MLLSDLRKDDMFLTSEEIKQLTGKVRRPSQVSALKQMRVNFTLRPDGCPIVLKSHIERVLDGKPESNKKKEEPDWDVINA